MKTLVLSTLATAFLGFSVVSFTSTPAVAVYDYPWCARSSAGQGGGPVCRFSTYEQCYATTVYSNGWCERNARIVEQEQRARADAR